MNNWFCVSVCRNVLISIETDFFSFCRFKPTALFGLAPELTPVYRHILHVYKIKHNTSFGEYYNKSHKFSSESHLYGFQGYNSGVVLINFKAQRKSTEFSTLIKNDSVYKLTSKYKWVHINVSNLIF